MGKDPMDIAEVRSKVPAHGLVPFNFAAVKGTGDADHASWWTFDDEQEIRDRWWRFGKEDLILDIGAAFGSYVLPALAQGARVVAFNPCQFDSELLDTNLNLNQELKKRCLHVRDGLYSEPGWFNSDTSEFSKEEKAGKAWLKCTTLDAFLDARPGIGDITWIKIDVEGAELDVLKGGEKCLRMYRPKILVENHEFLRPGIGDNVKSFILGLGLGYSCDGPHPHCAVSHSYFEAR